MKPQQERKSSFLHKARNATEKALVAGLAIGGANYALQPESTEPTAQAEHLTNDRKEPTLDAAAGGSSAEQRQQPTGSREQTDSPKPLEPAPMSSEDARRQQEHKPTRDRAQTWIRDVLQKNRFDYVNTGIRTSTGTNEFDQQRVYADEILLNYQAASHRDNDSDGIEYINLGTITPEVGSDQMYYDPGDRMREFVSTYASEQMIPIEIANGDDAALKQLVEQTREIADLITRVEADPESLTMDDLEYLREQLDGLIEADATNDDAE